MGKKSAKEKSPKVEDSHASSDPKYYVVSGILELDFPGLCKQNNVSHCPSVCVRQSQIQSQQAVTSQPSSKRSKDEKKSAHSQQSVTPKSIDEIQTPLGFNPTTFKLIKTSEYFQPKITVQQENPDKPETVNEVYIKGWKISESQWDILINCFTLMNKLCKLVFWRVGFTAEQITQLASFLSTNNTIKSLTIDANEALEIGTYAQLIDESNNVTKLQLRYCEIGPMEAKSISQRLGTIQTVNKKLISLDLSGNRLGDEGALYIAQALRTNRTLLTLSLSNNKIGDIGCIALAKVISQFFLTHEEIVYRRLCYSEKAKSESIPSNSSVSGRRKSKYSAGVRDSSKETTQGTGGTRKRERSVRGRNVKETADGSKDEKTTSKGKKADSSNSPKKGEMFFKGSETEQTMKDTKEKPDTNEVSVTTLCKEETDIQSTSSKCNQEQTRSGGKNKPARVTRSGKQASDVERPESSPEMNELMNPLLDKATYIEPYGLQIVGNFTLAFLNLSRNLISVDGFKALQEAVTYQTKILNSGNSSTNFGTGLLKLLLDNNLINDDSEILSTINEQLAPRDPSMKSTNSEKSIESELSSSNITTNS
ncbi:unnamed protein product [Trichobilharzia szidati]|nr:unnamed protein product [Trichobilharzia szidati]